MLVGFGHRPDVSILGPWLETDLVGSDNETKSQIWNLLDFAADPDKRGAYECAPPKLLGILSSPMRAFRYLT